MELNVDAYKDVKLNEKAFDAAIFAAQSANAAGLDDQEQLRHGIQAYMRVLMPSMAHIMGLIPLVVEVSGEIIVNDQVVVIEGCRGLPKGVHCRVMDIWENSKGTRLLKIASGHIKVISGTWYVERRFRRLAIDASL